MYKQYRTKEHKSKTENKGQMMIIDHVRDKDEFVKLYNERPMPNQYDIDFLLNNPLLFCLYDNDKDGALKAYITVQDEGGETTLSGASYPKNMPDNTRFIIMVCNAIKEDIYSYTNKKEAALMLRKAGFKHIKDDKYIRKYKNG